MPQLARRRQSRHRGAETHLGERHSTLGRGHDPLLGALDFELAEAERRFADQQIELAAFRALFQRRFARLYARLDELTAEFRRLDTQEGGGANAWENFEEARRRADESRQAADAAPDQPSPVGPANKELTSLYRAVARNARNLRTAHAYGGGRATPHRSVAGDLHRRPGRKEA